MNTRIIALVVLAALVSAFFYFDLSSYLTLEYIKSQQAALDAEQTKTLSASEYADLTHLG